MILLSSLPNEGSLTATKPFAQPSRHIIVVAGGFGGGGCWNSTFFVCRRELCRFQRVLCMMWCIIGPIFGIGVPTSSSAAMVESLRGLDRGGMFWPTGVAEIRLFGFVDANYARFRRVLCMMWSIILPCIFSHFSAHPHRYLITGNIAVDQKSVRMALKWATWQRPILLRIMHNTRR